MPAREIKTTLAIDGEKKFKAALAEAGREMSVMNSELRALASEFDGANESQEYFAAKSGIAAEKVKQQQIIVDALEQALKEMGESTKYSAKQMDDYTIKLNNARGRLADLKKASETAKEELQNLGKAEIEREFAASIDEATRSLKLSRSEAKLLGVTYKNQASDADYLAQRQENLKKQISAMEKIYIETAEAVKRSAEETGELSEKTVSLKIRMNDARIELTNMRREAEEAGRELEDLGRDSNKIGRQIENGIGDAAEDVSEKLDGMFDKVASDISALKGSVAWQTTMNVGEFVMEGISSVMDFVNENQELNRTIAITRHNIEQYGFKWEDVQDLIIRASAITGNQEGAFEAISNLAGAGFDNIDLMEAAMQALLGAYIQTGGALSFESLAEDFRASVVSRVPTGTYAEVLEEVLKGITIEEVQKAFEDVESDKEAIELALSYLTKGGMQTTAIDFEEKEKELLENRRKAEELTFAWAELANEITPVVTGLLDGTITLVDGLTEIVRFIKGAEEVYGMSREDFVQEGNKKTGGAIGTGADWGIFRTDFKEAFQNILDSLIPSAGAAELPPEYGEYGAQAFSTFEAGMQTAAEESTAGADAANALVSDMESANGSANTAGKNAMIYYANGIADGAPYVYRNLQTVMDSVNSILNSVAVPSWGGGLSGIGGGANPNTSASDRGTAVLQIDGQTAGRLLYSGVSSAGARKVKSTMIVK